MGKSVGASSRQTSMSRTQVQDLMHDLGEDPLSTDGSSGVGGRVVTHTRSVQGERSQACPKRTGRASELLQPLCSGIRQSKISSGLESAIKSRDCKIAQL